MQSGIARNLPALSSLEMVVASRRTCSQWPWREVISSQAWLFITLPCWFSKGFGLRNLVTYNFKTSNLCFLDDILFRALRANSCVFFILKVWKFSFYSAGRDMTGQYILRCGTIQCRAVPLGKPRISCRVENSQLLKRSMMMRQQSEPEQFDTSICVDHAGPTEK